MVRCSLVVYRLLSERLLNVATVRLPYITKGCLSALVILISEALNRSFANFDRLELRDPGIEKIVSETLFGDSFGVGDCLRYVDAAAVGVA